jgi:zinc transporter ZupT
VQSRNSWCYCNFQRHMKRSAQHHHNCANSVSSYMPAAYGPSHELTSHSISSYPATSNSKHTSYSTPSSWFWSSNRLACTRNCNRVWLPLCFNGSLSLSLSHSLTHTHTHTHTHTVRPENTERQCTKKSPKLRLLFCIILHEGSATL